MEMIGRAVFFGLAFTAALGVSAHGEKQVALKDVPGAVREAAERVLAGSALHRIVAERQGGRYVYAVEASQAGTTKEFTFASDGELLAEEEDLAFAELPEAVRQAAEKYFGAHRGLRASKETAKTVTAYEVEGKKSGTPMSLKFSGLGVLLAEDKDED